MEKKKKTIKRPKFRMPRDLRPLTTGEIHKIISEFESLKSENKKLSGDLERLEERLQDLEIHSNLLTRLLTTLCVEKFGMRIGVLKRIIKRIENEAIRDSQIDHLESLYKLAFRPNNKKRQPPSERSEDDPWEDIS